MRRLSPDQSRMAADARRRAERLVEQLRRELGELDAARRGSPLTAAALAAGRSVALHAAEAAGRTVSALEAAGRSPPPPPTTTTTDAEPSHDT